MTDGAADHVLTAGHCGPTGPEWLAGGRPVGATAAGGFPGDACSLVEYAGGGAGDGKGVRITGTGAVSVGRRVFRSGGTTGLRGGRVTAADAAVNHPEGTVTGLIETEVCAEAGDSGGPLFSEGPGTRYQLGRQRECVKGGTTFLQPVDEALRSLGVPLITAPPGRVRADRVRRTRDAGPDAETSSRRPVSPVGSTSVPACWSSPAAS